MFTDSRQEEKISKPHEKIAKPHEKIAKPQVKRTASVGKKATRPHKTSKHHHKKVSEKTNSEKTSTPTPATDAGPEVETIKDNFWKDLEDGKIVVDFGSDLYSKVKGSCRAARPKSFENMFKIRQPRPKKESAKVSGSKKKVKQEKKSVATETQFVDLTAADGDVSNSSESSARSSPDAKADDSVGLPVVNLGQRVDLGDGVGHGDCQSDDVDDKPLSHRVTGSNSDADSVNSKTQSAAKRDDTRSEQDLKKSSESLLTQNSSELSADVTNESPTIVDQVADVDSNNIFSRVSVDSNDSASRVESATLVDSNNGVSDVEPVKCVDSKSNTCVSNVEPVIPLDSNNRASNVEPVPSDIGPPPVCFPPPPTAITSTAPSSEYRNPPVNNNNTLTCSDPYKADANVPSSGTDLSACSKHVSMDTDQGIAESPDQTGGISASLTSLIDLNARHMGNEMKRVKVSSDDNPVPRMLLTDYQKSKAVPVGHVRAVSRPIEGTGSRATLTVPDISTILPRLNSKRQMSSFEDCTTPGSSLVDWGIVGNPSVFQMNGAVNSAPTCLASSGAQGGDTLYSSMVDYTQDVNMDDVRSLYSFVNPQSHDSSVDDSHAVAKKIRVDDADGTVQNPSATIPSGLDCILGADFINDHMVESMREIVRNTQSKPQGYSCDVQSGSSSGERNTDNLQGVVGDGPYDSSERLQDIDERIPMNVQAGMRQEYLPPPEPAVVAGNILFLRRQFYALFRPIFVCILCKCFFLAVIPIWNYNSTVV